MNINISHLQMNNITCSNNHSLIIICRRRIHNSSTVQQCHNNSRCIHLRLNIQHRRISHQSDRTGGDLVEAVEVGLVNLFLNVQLVMFSVIIARNIITLLKLVTKRSMMRLIDPNRDSRLTRCVLHMWIGTVIAKHYINQKVLISILRTNTSVKKQY